MRDRHASRESSAEPDAIRSMFLVDAAGALLEALAVGAAVLMDESVELIDGPDIVFMSLGGLDEPMDEPDEDVVSSVAQPAVSSAMNASMPAILAIPGLISHSSVLQWMMDMGNSSTMYPTRVLQTTARHHTYEPSITGLWWQAGSLVAADFS